MAYELSAEVRCQGYRSDDEIRRHSSDGLFSKRATK
jgi:hypothetical protein